MVECTYLPVDSVGIEDIVPLNAKYHITNSIKIWKLNNLPLLWINDDMYIINYEWQTTLCVKYNEGYFSAFDVTDIDLSLLHGTTLAAVVTERKSNLSIKNMVLGIVAKTPEEKIIAKLTFG